MRRLSSALRTASETSSSSSSSSSAAAAAAPAPFSTTGFQRANIIQLNVPVSAQTLRRWADSGQVRVMRTNDRGHRLYCVEDVYNLWNKRHRNIDRTAALAARRQVRSRAAASANDDDTDDDDTYTDASDDDDGGGDAGVVNVTRVASSAAPLRVVGSVQRTLAYARIDPFDAEGSEFVVARRAQAEVHMLRAIRDSPLTLPGVMPVVYVDVVPATALWSERHEYWRMIAEVRSHSGYVVYVDGVDALGTDSRTFDYHKTLLRLLEAHLIDLRMADASRAQAEAAIAPVASAVAKRRKTTK